MSNLANTLFGPQKVSREFRGKAPAQQLWKPLTPGAVLLALDPSIANCGFAVLRNDRQNPTRLDSGIFHPVFTQERPRCDHLAMLITDRLERSARAGWKVTDAIIEIPAGGQWGRSATQLMVYARAIGVCEAACFLGGLRMHRATVSEWKGSGKKCHTALVAKHVFKYEPRDDNESDALGLGLWLCSKVRVQCDRKNG